MVLSLYDQYKQLGVFESVCIAFFDLVDSTNLKKQLGQAKGVDLTMTHNNLAATVCEQFRGKVIKHIGDSIMVVFETPLDGIFATLEFTRKITEENLPFSTKAGLVHGLVKKVDINGLDYLGHSVDRSARLTARALPNQILTDETTIDMIKPFINDFNQMISRFIGIHELKGMGKVPVYELALKEQGFIEESEKQPTTEPISRTRLELPPLVLPQPTAHLIKDAPIEKILENGNLSMEDLENVAVGHQNLTHILENAHDLYIQEITLSGSFARGTAIRPLGEIDVIAVLTPPSNQQYEVAKVLGRLEQILSLEYPGSMVAITEQSLSIVLQGIQLNVIPVLASVENGQRKLIMPSKGGWFWVERNPAIPEKWMEQAIERNGETFLPFLRVIKAWQHNNCSFVNSFHLELLTDLIASKTNLELSFESVYQWFWFAYHFFSQNKKPFIREPNRTNVFIDEYMYTNSMVFGRFGRILTDSYNLAKQGITYQRAGETKMSLTRWKALFGKYI